MGGGRAPSPRAVVPMEALVGGILIVLGLIMAEGLLTMAGFALGAARKSRLPEWWSRGDRGVLAALRLSDDPKGFARAIQVGITLLCTAAGVCGGAILEPEISRAIEQCRPLAPHRLAIGVAAVVVGITLATLVLAELA